MEAPQDKQLIHVPDPIIIWEPQPGSQVSFLTCPYEEVLYAGTRGPGKTDALLMKFAQHVGEGYGEAWRGIIFRKTYKQLSDVIAKSQKWFKQIFPFARYNKSEHQWEFPGGETLLFRYMDNAIDYWNYHGHEYPFIGWEELTNWADSGCYDSMKSCNRSSYEAPPGILPMPRFYGGTCNPFGIGHHWVKARFIDQGPAKKPVIETFIHPLTGEKIYMRRCYIHGDWRENRKLVDNDPLYIAKLMGIKDENKRKAWLEGDWNITAGSILGAWYNQAVHEIEPFNIPHSWRIDRSFDYGSSKPFSIGWWAESDGTLIHCGNTQNPMTGRVSPQFKSWPKGTLFRINEWYGCKEDQPNVGLEMLTKDIAKGIVERETAMLQGGFIKTKPKPGPADSSIFDVLDGKSIAAEMKKEGVTWLPANKSPGSRRAGWELLRNLLSSALDKDEHMNPIYRTTPMEEPGLFVFNTCRGWIRTVPMMPRDTDKPDDVDTKCEDHCFTGDTTILTAAGVKTLLELVGTTGCVLTAGGIWAPYDNCQLVKQQAETVTVTLSDGSHVRCTPDHLFMTKDGWKEALYLSNETCYNIYNVSIRRLLWSHFKSALQSKSSLVLSTTFAGLTFSMMVSDYTGWFIRIIMGQFQKVLQCITMMKIRAITSLQTLTYAQIVSMPHYTRVAEQITNSQIRPEWLLPHGTGRLKDWPGTVSKVNATGNLCLKNRWLACIVAPLKQLRLLIGHSLNTAPMPVKRQHAVPLEQTMKIVSVSFAALHLLLTSIFSLRPVVEAVEQSCVGNLDVVHVLPDTNADVYCLNVPNYHAFTLSNGLLVHNCGDETRYRIYKRTAESGSSELNI